MNKAQAQSFVEEFESYKERWDLDQNGGFPEQKLTLKEKEKKYGSEENWVKAVLWSLRHVSGYYSRSDRTLLDLQANFDLARGRFVEEFYSHIRDFYPDSVEVDQETNTITRGKPTFPAKLRHYDIISTRLNRLLGEEITRPFDCSVVCTSPSVVSQKIEKKQQLIKEYTERLLVEAIANNPNLKDVFNPEALTDVQGYPQDRQEIDELSGYTLKERIEKWGADALKFLYEKQELRNKFVDGFKNILYAYYSPYYVGIHNNQPVLRVVDPRWFECDRTKEDGFIEDSSWAREIRIIPVTQVYDEFGEYLTEEKIDRLEQLKGRGFRNTFIGDDPNVAFESNLFSSTDIKVVHVEWKTLKKVGHLRYKEDGEWYETIVDEEYPTKGFRKEPRIRNRNKIQLLVHEDGRELEWKWIQEVWQAVEAGDEVLLHYGPKPNQHRSLDNPNECKLGYCGVFVPYPIMEQLKPLQVMHNIIMYRLDLAIAKAKGEVAVIDIAQIPFSKDFDLNKAMYYMEAMNVLYINSLEEGTGSQAGMQSRFNQFSSIDMTNAKTIQALILVLEMIWGMVAEITGIPEQALGAVGQYETTSGVRQAINQSAFVTEPIFFIHREAKKRVVKLLIEASQVAWESGKVGQYVMDDGQLHLFDIDGDQYSLSNYDVHVTDDNKYKRIMEFIEMNAASAVQAGQISMADCVKIMESSSLSDKKRILEIAQKAQEALNMQDIQAQQQAAQQQVQMKLQETQMKIEAELQMNQNDNQTKIVVAEIQANTALKDDIRNTVEYINAENDMEREKILNDRDIAMSQQQLDKERLDFDKETKRKELSIKDKEADAKMVAARKPNSTSKK
jgi:hypothetical protein